MDLKFEWDEEKEKVNLKNRAFLLKQRQRFSQTKTEQKFMMKCTGAGGVMMKKALPIGVENFKNMVETGYYYVDKTMFIKELLDRKEK